MIAKGNTHGDGVKLAAYLVTGEHGERAELLDMRGFATNDIHAAFRDIENAKKATKADAAFFHIQIRGVDGEGSKLSRAQWLEIANGCDAALGRGMARQGRAASLHIDGASGDMHMHLAYDLIRQRPDGRLYVAKLGLFETRLQLYAREIEKKYGLRIVSNERRPGARRAERREQEESRRLGTDSHAIRSAILDTLEKSDGGKAFAAAIRAQGMELAAGDRRDCFVVVDEAGGQHALNKRLTGKTLAEIGARLSDLDRAQLPTVEAAQEMQRARQPARQAARAARAVAQHRQPTAAPTPPGKDNTRTSAAESGPQPAIKPLSKTAGDIRMTWTLSRSQEELKAGLAERGMRLARATPEEAERSHRSAPYLRAIGKYAAEFDPGEILVVNRFGNAVRLDQRTTGDLRAEIDKRLSMIDAASLPNVTDAKAAVIEAEQQRKAERQQERRAEWERSRPKTKMEAAIAQALSSTMTGTEFAARLDGQGLAVARVKESDVAELEELRRDEAREISCGERKTAHHFARLSAGDLAVVTPNGHVFRLNPNRVDCEEIGQRLADVQRHMPGVIETRQHFAAQREKRAAEKGQRTADYVKGFFERQDERATRNMQRDRQEARHADFAAGRRADARTLSAIERELDRGVTKSIRTGSRALSAVFSAFEKIFDLFGGGEPVLTPQQAKLARRAAMERREQAAVERSFDEREQAKQELRDEMVRHQEGRRVIARSRGDDYGRELER